MALDLGKEANRFRLKTVVWKFEVFCHSYSHRIFGVLADNWRKNAGCSESSRGFSNTFKEIYIKLWGLWQPYFLQLYCIYCAENIFFWVSIKKQLHYSSSNLFIKVSIFNKLCEGTHNNVDNTLTDFGFLFT